MNFLDDMVDSTSSMLYVRIRYNSLASAFISIPMFFLTKQTIKELYITTESICRTGVRYLMNALKNNMLQTTVYLSGNLLRTSLCIDTVNKLRADQVYSSVDIYLFH